MAARSFGPEELDQLFKEGVRRVTDDERQQAALLARALELAGEPCTPDDEQQFAVFVGGPLYHAAEDILGIEAANALMTFFEPIFGTWLKMSSTGRWRRPTPPVAPSVLDTVVVACADFFVANKLVAGLAKKFTVRVVRDGKQALDTCRDHPPRAFVVDASLPGPVPAAKLCKLVMMATQLPAERCLILGDLAAPAGMRSLPRTSPPEQVLAIINAP
jgi:hypothetical protein